MRTRVDIALGGDYGPDLCFNDYNLELMLIEDSNDWLEMRSVIWARSNLTPWMQNVQTGYEVMLRDITIFVQPKETAPLVRETWD